MKKSIKVRKSRLREKPTFLCYLNSNPNTAFCLRYCIRQMKRKNNPMASNLLPHPIAVTAKLGAIMRLLQGEM